MCQWISESILEKSGIAPDFGKTVRGNEKAFVFYSAEKIFFERVLFSQSGRIVISENIDKICLVLFAAAILAARDLSIKNNDLGEDLYSYHGCENLSADRAVVPENLLAGSDRVQLFFGKDFHSRTGGVSDITVERSMDRHRPLCFEKNMAQKLKIFAAPEVGKAD